MTSQWLLRAGVDRRLRGFDYRVMIYLETVLDPFEFRSVALKQIPCVRRKSLSTAVKTMRRLVDCGYLSEGPRIERWRSYRLTMPPPAPHAVPQDTRKVA